MVVISVAAASGLACASRRRSQRRRRKAAAYRRTAPSAGRRRPTTASARSMRARGRCPSARPAARIRRPSGASSASTCCGLMPGHDDDALRRRQRSRGRRTTCSTSAQPSGAMQHLGALRSHARAQSRGQNHDTYRIHDVSSASRAVASSAPAPAPPRRSRSGRGGSFPVVRAPAMRTRSAPTTFKPHTLQILRVVFHRPRGAGLITVQHFAAESAAYSPRTHRSAGRSASGVPQQRRHMIGRAKIGGLARLRHQVHEVRFAARATAAIASRNAVHQQIRNHAGEQRSRAQRDQVRLGDRLQRFRQRLGTAADAARSARSATCCG